MSSSSTVKPLWQYAKDGKLDDVKSLTSTVEGAAKIHDEKDEVSDWYSYSCGLGESSVSLLSILLLPLFHIPVSFFQGRDNKSIFIV